MLAGPQAAVEGCVDGLKVVVENEKEARENLKALSETLAKLKEDMLEVVGRKLPLVKGL